MAATAIEFEDQKKVISLDTLILDPVKVLFGEDVMNDMNVQGMVLGAALMGYVAGNSIGTAKTAAGLGATPNKSGRLALGSIYFW